MLWKFARASQHQCALTALSAQNVKFISSYTRGHEHVNGALEHCVKADSKRRRIDARAGAALGSLVAASAVVWVRRVLPKFPHLSSRLVENFHNFSKPTLCPGRIKFVDDNKDGRKEPTSRPP